MERPRVLLLATVMVASLWATDAVAQAGPVCLTPGNPEDIDAVLFATIDAEWPTAATLRDIRTPLVRCATPAGCPTDAAVRLLLSTNELHVIAWDGTAYSRRLDELDVGEKAQVVLHAALDVLEADTVADAPFRAADPAPPAPPARWGLLVGGAWTVQRAPGAHRGLVDLSGQVALLDEIVLLGLRVGWLPRQSLHNAPIDTTWSELDLAVTAAGTLRLGDFRLRAGGGIGTSRGWLESRTVTRTENLVESDWRLLLLAELEVEWAPWRSLRLSLSAGGRFQPGSTAYLWRNEPLLRTASAAGTVALRVGWWFN